MNASGYLVNSAGEYLSGWAVDPNTNIVGQNSLIPVQIDQQTFDPQPTRQVTFAASPATPASPLSSQITVDDALGRAQSVNLNWSRAVDVGGATIPNQWSVEIHMFGAVETLADGTAANYDTNVGVAAVTFGVPAAAAGTMLPAAGTIESIAPVALGAGSLNPLPTIGPTTTSVSIPSGAIPGSPLVPVDSALALSARTTGIKGSPSIVTIRATRNVITNYDNGQTRTIAQIPTVTSPNPLQSQHGQALTAPPAGGTPLAVGASPSRCCRRRCVWLPEGQP